MPSKSKPELELLTFGIIRFPSNQKQKPETMNVRQLLWILALSVTLSACSTQSLKVERLTSETYPPTDLVEVLRTPPTRSYQTIATIQASDVPGTPMAQVMANIVLEARSLGADAVIIEDRSRMAPEEMVFNPAGGYYEPRPSQLIPDVKATVIRWSQADFKQNN